MSFDTDYFFWIIYNLKSKSLTTQKASCDMIKPCLQSLARFGENWAKVYYEKHQYKLLEKNFRCLGSEIDLIFQKKNLLIFVEVKLRKKSCSQDLLVSDLIPPRKKKSLRRGALSFLEKKNPSFESIRFDLCVLNYNLAQSQKIVVSNLKIYQDIIAEN